MSNKSAAERLIDIITLAHQQRFNESADSPMPHKYCNVCGSIKFAYFQPSWIPTKKGHWDGHCCNSECNMYMLTDSLED